MSDWIDWNGGECPVPEDAMVAYVLRSGFHGSNLAGMLRWNHEVNQADIVQYRISQNSKYAIDINKNRQSGTFADDLDTVLSEIREIMIEKNRKYGDSALSPKRVFSKASAIEQINVRLDDKLSRLMSGQLDDTEDVELDLVGYILLKRIAQNREKEEKK